MSPATRRVVIPVAVAFAILVPVLQSALDLGLSPSEFASDGDRTLRAAGYAFSIWSLIYAGLVAYAAWQALPRNAANPLLASVAGPSVVAIAGCGLWICASALDWKWASVAIIIASAATLTAGLLHAARTTERPGLTDRLFVWWPLSLLAGWLTIASAINILTVLTAEGLLAGLPKTAAFAGIVAVLVAALFVLRSGRLSVYGIPIAWGFVAVWAAEKATKSDVAALALGSAVLVGTYAAWQARPNAAPR